MIDFPSLTRRGAVAALSAVALLAIGATAQAADKVKVGVFPVASALPYFVALERDYFKDADIDVELVRLIGGPALVGAMITNDIDAAANLVTIEGMNANLKKPGVVNYISINSQNKKFKMEQFVVNNKAGINSYADLKGKKINVGARTGEHDDGARRACRQRSEGRRLSTRPIGHAAARYGHEGGHL